MAFKSELAYTGVSAVNPPDLVRNTRRPTANDILNFTLGTFWIIPHAASGPSEECWVLVDKSGGVATWIELSAAADVVPGANYTVLISDGSGGFGTSVGPGTAGQVFLSGGAGASPAYVTPTAGSGLSITTNASTLQYALTTPISTSNGGTGLSGVTAFTLLVGDGTNPLVEVAPSATSGVPVISQGAAANPAYGTAVVAGGGTGRTSLTAYNLLVGNGTSAVTLVAPHATTGIPLVSQGAAADPAYSTAVVAGGGTGRTSLTSHYLLVGNGTSAVTLLAPHVTTGIPLVSQGAASDPAYSTAVVAGGGTGLTSATAYAVLCGGTTSTGAFQSIASVGTAGQVLKSNGAGMLPTFQTGGSGFDSMNVQIFTSNGTYTPTAGMAYCVVEVLGAGGGGGGCSTASTAAVAPGGGAGGYARAIFDSTTIGASKAVTIGTGGAGGTSAPTSGSAGGNTTFGGLLTGNGGSGGQSVNNGSNIYDGGAGGSASGASYTGALLTVTGENGYFCTYNTGGSPQYGLSGKGGDTIYGNGGHSVSGTKPGTDGNDGSGYGSGGSGGAGFSTGTGPVGAAGGDGANGICIITEFIA